MLQRLVSTQDVADFLRVAILGDDSMRGALMAVDDFGGKVGGKKIEIVKGSSDGSPDSAVRAVRKLVEQVERLYFGRDP
jgi:ABC-type branched-subunit amino acid transport system substrate-binding protein